MSTDEKIKRSALRLFVERGFSCPTSAITKDAGVSQGILFHYYPTKNDLILDLYAETLSSYFEEAILSLSRDVDTAGEYESVLRTTWLSQVDWCLDHWLEFCYMRAFEESQLSSLYISDERAGLQGVGDFLDDQISRGIEMGVARDMDPTFLAHIGNAATAATVRYLHMNPERREDEAFMDQVWHVYRSINRPA